MRGVVRQRLGLPATPWDDESKRFGHQTLRDHVALLDDALLQQINARLAAAGREVFAKKGGAPLAALAVKVDTYVLETDIHFPTDLNLLWDAGRKCVDWIVKCRDQFGHSLPGWRKAKAWRRQLKACERTASQLVYRGGPNQEARRKRAVRDYLSVGRALGDKVRASLSLLCDQPVALADREALEHFQGMLTRHLDLVERRLLREETIPAHEKVFSLFEPHTEWTQKGQQRPDVELGPRLLLATDQNQLIQDHAVAAGVADVDRRCPWATGCRAGMERARWPARSLLHPTYGRAARAPATKSRPRPRFDFARKPVTVAARMIRNVIFDWSGTLVDDLPAVWETSNHLFEQAGVPPLSLEQFRAEFRLPYRGFYDKFVPHVGLDQLEVWFRAKFMECQESVVALPHAREFLEFCAARELRTFLLSTVHPHAYAHQARTTDLGGFIHTPYTGIADKRAKIAELLTDHGLRPEETVFIGDMEHDIETARHGGIRSVAVLTGYNSLAQLRAAEPDLVVEHLGELRAVLERNDGRLPAVRGRSQPAPEPPRPIATVGGLIFNDAGEVLMIRTNKWSDRWGIPGGKIEFGEPSVDALCREVKEETDLDVTDVRFVLVQDAIHPPEFHRDAHFLLLNYTCLAPGTQAVRLNDEGQEHRWVTIGDAFSLPLNAPTRVLLESVRNRPLGH